MSAPARACDAAGLIGSLAWFADALPAAVGGLGPDEGRWRPEDGAWSVLEVVCHLGDEEVEDFRRRLELTLADPTRTWPPIDPEGVAGSRRYNEGDLDEAVKRFVAERRASLAWLGGLVDPDWSRTHQHPAIGPLRAGDLLASWAAHDALHLRQIAKRRFQLVQRDAGGYGTRYAGGW